MNRRVVGTAGIPAGVLRADCHAGKDAGGPRFMGSFHVFQHMRTAMNTLGHINERPPHPPAGP